jgi:deoxyguanosine kinase
VVLENFENNLFLPLFYQELQKNGPTSYNKYSLPSQLQFLKNRIDTEKNCNEQNKIYIIERSIAEDRFIFVENMYRNGLMTLEELQRFDIEREEKSKNLDNVDLFVFLRASPEKVLERIISRGRESEKGISEQYLASLHELYENKLLVELRKLEDFSKVLIYDVDEVGIEELANLVARDVESFN